MAHDGEGIKRVMVSGGFDPLHIGHIRLFQKAAQFGDLTVIMNSDDWLVRKKGYFVMPWRDRAEILLAMKGINCVGRVEDEDGTVSEALRRIRPDYFVKSGDRTAETTPEMQLCEELGIRVEFVACDVDHIHSSGLIERAAREFLKRNAL